jgi:transcriptional repressor NrdR
MRCPYCGELEDKVVDSRLAEQGNAIRRRRECLNCGRRTTTYERIDELPLMVVKRSGYSEPFDRAKLGAGIAAATGNGPITPDLVVALVAAIEDEMRESGPEVGSELVGIAVLDRLRALHKPSYLRFASVYKGFETVEDFEREVGELQKTTAPKPREGQ